VDVPLFEDHLPPCIGVEGSGVGMSSGYLTAMRLRSHARSNSARLHVRLQDPHGCSAPQSEVQALSRGGLLDDIGVPAELITDRGSDEIGPIRIESLLDHQVDVPEVDVAEVDRDLFGVMPVRPEPT
jgi:hypothetical protein